LPCKYEMWTEELRWLDLWIELQSITIATSSCQYVIAYKQSHLAIWKLRILKQIVGFCIANDKGHKGYKGHKGHKSLTTFRLSLTYQRNNLVGYKLLNWG